MLLSDQVEAFISAPIKLAALIRSQRQSRNNQYQSSCSSSARCAKQKQEALSRQKRQQNPLSSSINFPSSVQLCSLPARRLPTRRPAISLLLLALSALLIGCCTRAVVYGQRAESLLRHQAHYLNIVPSTHFQYSEGRQFQDSASQSGALLAGESVLQPEVVPMPPAPLQAAPGSLSSAAHIYKRSSALISPHYAPLVNSMHSSSSNPMLRRRMMSESVVSRARTGRGDSFEDQLPMNGEQLLNQLSQQTEVEARQQRHQKQQLQQQQQHRQPKPSNLVSAAQEAELLRQKQHIQYHDQWPSMAGKCHKRTLNFCASVLPFNTTTFPNIIGDTNRFEVKRSLPFFGFLAKSSCNKRLDELLCLLLEPPCSSQSGAAIPPCKKFCRLALEGCNEYIPATLAMSSVFDCRQYPDSNDPSVCVNLAQGSKCADDEFKCPDKTCIPRNWLCDGVRDCIFAADEANCTALTGVGLQTSVCSTEEFKCDGKCVPKAWKCDGERDCLDGSDEESCDHRPRCGPDRFRCADGNGCLPKRWVCDGKAECRDGSDELNCEQLECSENDFKCDNGICIPKLWRCDRQADCKDASDERGCLFPTTTATPTTAPTSPPPPTTAAAAATSGAEPASSQQIAANSTDAPIQQSINHQQITQAAAAASGDNVELTAYADQPQASSQSAQQQPDGGKLEKNLGDDVSRIIRQQQQQSAANAASGAPSASAPSAQIQEEQPSGQQLPPQEVGHRKQQLVQAKELNKFDYDLIQSASVQQASSLAHLNELSADANMGSQQPKASLLNQIEFVQQQQQQQLAASRRPPATPTLRQPALVERVPIYRSLFKTLKSGAGNQARGNQLQHGRGGATGRRRRERVVVNRQLQQQQSAQTTQNVDGLSSSMAAHELASSSPAPNLGANQQHHHHQNQNQTRPTGHHGVASYLQLLNNRYNLRLPRVPNVRA